MIIYFVELETEEQEFYGAHLADEDLRSVTHLEEVEADAEIVCVFIGTPIGAEFLRAHPNLKLVVTRSNSVEHLDLEACRAHGVEVRAAPAYGETTVAEHTFALLLALSRRLREVMTLPGRKQFTYAGTRGFDLRGKTIGLLGLGKIGRQVAALAKGFGMEVLATDPVEDPEIARELGLRYVELKELLGASRVLSLHANLTPETRHLINRQTLAQCQRGVWIINTARGALIETQALREALDTGQVAGAGLDVLEDERVMRQNVSQILSADIVRHLHGNPAAPERRDAVRLQELQELLLGDAILSRPNVVFTPHVAFNSVEAVAELRAATLENLRSFLGGP